METKLFISGHYDSFEKYEKDVQEYATTLESRGFSVEISDNCTTMLIPRPNTGISRVPTDQTMVSPVPFMATRVTGYSVDDE